MNDLSIKDGGDNISIEISLLICKFLHHPDSNKKAIRVLKICVFKKNLKPLEREWFSFRVDIFLLFLKLHKLK